MTESRACSTREPGVPGLTACALCAGETLGAADTLDGGQLARLRELEYRGLVRLTLSDCLGQCDRGDVVVVRPIPGGASRAARPVWLERLAGVELTQALADWLSTGGPGCGDTPEPLVPLEIRRTTEDAG